MKRGERKVWRAVAAAAEKIAASSDYAEEYMAKIEFDRCIAELFNPVKGVPAHERLDG